jgi:hypothetical protein
VGFTRFLSLKAAFVQARGRCKRLMNVGRTLAMGVTAVAASAGILVSTSPAGASSVPALLSNPALCSNPLPKYTSGCHNVIEPKTWYWTGDGSAGLYDLHWTKWGAQEAEATGMLSLRIGNWQQPPLYGWHHFAVEVEATVPVELQGHYIYATVYTFPLHPQPANTVANQTVPDLYQP